jgi:hypothetical protein
LDRVILLESTVKLVTPKASIFGTLSLEARKAVSTIITELHDKLPALKYIAPFLRRCKEWADWLQGSWYPTISMHLVMLEDLNFLLNWLEEAKGTKMPTVGAFLSFSVLPLKPLTPPTISLVLTIPPSFSFAPVCP